MNFHKLKSGKYFPPTAQTSPTLQNLSTNSSYFIDSTPILETFDDKQSSMTELQVVVDEIPQSKSQIEIKENQTTGPKKFERVKKIRTIPIRTPKYTVEPIACDICPRTFTRKLHLENHQKTHDKPFECKYCKKNFNTETEVTNHVAAKHDNRGPFDCEFCFKRFTVKMRLDYHIKIHHTKEVFECKYCDKKFATFKYVRNHEMRHNKQFRCHQCGYKYTTNRNLLEHIRIKHENPYSFECQICNKKFTNEKGLYTHKKLHDSHEGYSCDICGKTFKLKSYVYTHKATHIKKFECDLCDKKCAQKAQLMRHLRLEHENPGSFECDICHKRFDLKPRLDTHKKTHRLESQFECELCDKAFKTETYLKHHMTRHAKTFECSLCDKRFGYDYELKNHVLMEHENPKSIECDICFQRFSLKHRFQTHRKIHEEANNPRNLECDMCGKMFRTKRHLKFHQNTHVKEHECEYCDKRFAHHYEMKSHIVTEHENPHSFECDICSIKFTSRYVYYAHRKKHMVGNEFCCSVCSKTFKIKDELKKHEKAHEKRLKCEFCQKKFLNGQDLASHSIKEHGKLGYINSAVLGNKLDSRALKAEDKFICIVCGKFFVTEHTLERHEKLHDDGSKEKVDKKCLENELKKLCGDDYENPWIFGV